MKSYYLFFKENYSPVIFGWLLTLFSSFGQTFFISLFVPAILSQFDLSKSMFGGYYALATIIASFFLLQFGHMVDSHPLKPFTLKTIFLLIVSCVFLAIAFHPAMVFLSLIGLRLSGQGLMSHISLSVMSRHFDEDRGKALSLSSLGYPFGEIIFPLFIGLILSFWDWHIALFISAFILLIIFFTISNFNLDAYDTSQQADASSGNKWQYFGQLIKERTFFIVIIPVFTFSFVTTGMFFFQYILAKERGWPMEWYAMCFAAYAIVRLLFVLYGGILTDKFSARKLYPFYLIPVILGLVALATVPGQMAALLFLMLTGISAGTSSILSSAVIAELYGTARVGQVRSLFSMIMVVSTALSPVLFGYLLDNHISFNQIAFSSAGLLILATLNSFRLKEINQAKPIPS